MNSDQFDSQEHCIIPHHPARQRNGLKYKRGRCNISYEKLLEKSVDFVWLLLTVNSGPLNHLLNDEIS